MITKKKNLLMLLGVGLTVGTLLTGCGNNSNGNSSGDDQENVTIRFSWWGNDDRHQATLEMIEKFEELHPNISVKAEYSGWDGIEEKMAIQLAGGTEPDLMQMNFDWFMVYSPEGDGFYNLEDLTEYLDLSGYSEDSLEPGRINGKLNSVNFGENIGGVVYNKTTFDKFGVPIPETWDDLVEAAKEFPDGYYPLSGLAFHQIA